MGLNGPRPRTGSEVKPQRELNYPWAMVRTRYGAKGTQRCRIRQTSYRIGAERSAGYRNPVPEAGVGIPPASPIENVEHVCPQLECNPLVDPRVLDDPEILVGVARAARIR